MHTTPIQKLSFILLILTNTQVRATSIGSIHDKDICKMSVEKNLNTSYDQEREIKKEKLRQRLLEGTDYYNKKEGRNKLRKQVQRIAHIKRMGKQEISEQEQGLLDTDKKLGKEIQGIEQSVEQKVAIKYPYSGQKGYKYDTTRIFKEELETERKRNKEELEAERKKNKEELDTLRKKNKEELGTKEAGHEHEHEIWIQNRAKKVKEEEIKEKEFFKKEKAKRRKAEEEFFNRLRAQEESHNSNSNSNPQGASKRTRCTQKPTFGITSTILHYGKAILFRLPSGEKRTESIGVQTEKNKEQGTST